MPEIPTIASAILNIVTSHTPGSPVIGFAAVYIGAVGLFTFDTPIMYDPTAWGIRTDTFIIDSSLFLSIEQKTIHLQFTIASSMPAILDPPEQFFVYYAWMVITWSNGQVSICRPVNALAVQGSGGGNLVINPLSVIDQGSDAGGGNATTFATITAAHSSGLAFQGILQITAWDFPPPIFPLTVSSTFDAPNYYFSGQGVMMIGSRDVATGLPVGLCPIGNVSDLKIEVSTDVISHKYAQDGKRNTDKRLRIGETIKATFVVDNWMASNLAMALSGAATRVLSGIVEGEYFFATPGLVSGLQFINVSRVAIEFQVTPDWAIGPELVPYSDDDTPWDFKVNNKAGSIKLNDGKGAPPVILGAPISTVAVGVSTVITVPNTAVVGDKVVLIGLTGIDCGYLNGQTVVISAADSGTITLAVNTVGLSIGSAGGSVGLFLTQIPLLAYYNYSSQSRVESFVNSLEDVWLRFEGLNTVEGNEPVIVDLFKFEADPLKELALLSDTFSSMAVEGELIKDTTRPITSQCFSVRML